MYVVEAMTMMSIGFSQSSFDRITIYGFAQYALGYGDKDLVQGTRVCFLREVVEGEPRAALRRQEGGNKLEGAAAVIFLGGCKEMELADEARNA